MQCAKRKTIYAKNNKNMIFFGTDSFSITVLEKLKEHGILPTHIVTVPDKPQGRKMIMTSPLAKLWGESQNIPVLQFEKLNTEAEEKIRGLISSDDTPSDTSDVFIVASYGKIIPERILNIPTHGALNIHPSLLPKYRGASPIQYTILSDDKELGVVVIKMDKEMDHGPIVAEKILDQKEIVKLASSGTDRQISWPLSYDNMEKTLAKIGADLIADVLPKYLKGKIEPKEQNHALATFTKKIEKEDGLIVPKNISPKNSEVDARNDSDEAFSSIEDLSSELSGENGYKNFLKFQAFSGWPSVYFFINKLGQNIRVRIKEAVWNESENIMKIMKITPEGKKDMGWKDFQNFLKN